MSDRIRVLLVDDQELIRTGFRLLLLGEPGISVVGESGDGQSALDELERLRGGCDVVLMDVRMPRMNGIDATTCLVRQYPNVKVLVLTTFDLDEYAQAAIRAGASGFLLKDARPTELVDAIMRVAAGDAVMAPTTTKRMLERMLVNGQADAGVSDGRAGDPSGHSPAPIEVGAKGMIEAEAKERLSVLTEREREVFGLIAEGCNNAEISARLFLSESTVKTHVGRVLFKLNVRDRIHAVILARELDI